MSILEGCRGPHKTPIPEERRCPACGEEVEVFTVRGRIVAESVCECGYVFNEKEPYVSPGLQKIFDEAKKRAEEDG
ncbi:MAG: hypothetical protein IKH56_10715 [Oscillospiraceae bacterium]|nr:hypothetical protein [Oscillospiraceae bacterium]